MKLSVKVKTNAKVNSVQCDGESCTVSVTKAPVDGKANEMVIKLLAKYFKVAPSLVRIVSGASSRNKVIEIENVSK